MNEQVEVRRAGYTVLQDWVIDRDDLTGPEKLAYMALCRHANKAGECFPSFATIAKKMSTSRKTAKRAVLSLVEKGLVKYKERQDQAGDQTSHLYTITDGVGSETTGVGSQLPHGGVTDTLRVGSQLPPKDSQSKESQRRKETPPAEDSREEAAAEEEVVSESEMREWIEDYRPLKIDAPSLKRFNALPYAVADKRKALRRWMSADTGDKTLKLAWFLSQGHELLEEAKDERELGDWEIRQTQEYLARRAREEKEAREAGPLPDDYWEQLKDRVSA